MGKHDKQDETVKVIAARVSPDEYYKERIEKLVRYIKERDKEIEALEHKIEIKDGCINELRADLGDLILENQALKDAVVRAALREVE